MYNYWLGGKDHFAADWEAAEQAIAANPGIVADVRANRAFLVRAVRHLAAEYGQASRHPDQWTRPGLGAGINGYAVPQYANLRVRPGKPAGPPRRVEGRNVSDMHGRVRDARV